MDPRLLSVHLEGNPRHELFRAARARLERASGNHTLAGELRAPLDSPGLDNLTIAPKEIKFVPGTTSCWLLDRGKQIPLKVGMNSIGRLPDNDIVIDDPTVSRRHCAILVHSDLICEIHDVASKNGTLVNGKRIAGPTRLSESDEIELSERRLTFLVRSGDQTQDRPMSQPALSADERTMAGSSVS